MSQLQMISGQFDSKRQMEEQQRLAWERDQARIQDFFNHPGQYITEYWQQYKPIAVNLLIVALALFAVNFVLGLIHLITSLPLISPLLKLVGLGYTSWFVYRYLLKAETRQELVGKFNIIKQEVIGAAEEVIGDSSINVKKQIMIQKSPEQLYQFWRNFENLPRFMNHVQSITIIDDKRSHWVVKAPLDTTVQWDAEIIDEKPNQSIVWRSLENAEVDSVGSVTFTSMNGSGTEVQVTMKYNPPAGVVGAAAAALFGENPEQQLDEDLNRFKQVMESM